MSAPRCAAARRTLIRDAMLSITHGLATGVLTMTTKQGSLDLLNDPVAQKLFQSTIPARLAYVWHDGTPRVVPIGFHWDGKQLVLGTPMAAPKLKVIDGAK